MTRRNAPRKADPPPAVMADLAVETPETIEEIQPEIRSKKNHGLPPDKFSMNCGKCGSECAVHIKDPSAYTKEQIAQLFVDRGGSYDPPRCGFCLRKEQLQAGKYKSRLEPPDWREIVKETAA